MKTRIAQDNASGGRVGSRGRGFILVAVLIVVMLASMVVVSLLFRLQAEESATAAGAGSEQAWATAMSGIYEAMRVVGAAPVASLECRTTRRLS